MVIQGFQRLCTGLGAITVGVEQFSIDPAGFPLFRILYLAELEVIFFDIPLQGRLDDTPQIRRFLADMGERIFFRVEMFQKRRHGFIADRPVTPTGFFGCRRLYFS